MSLICWVIKNGKLSTVRVVGMLDPQPRPSRTLGLQTDLFKQIRPGVLLKSQFPPDLADATNTFTKPNCW
jgi:hypothetical protein